VLVAHALLSFKPQLFRGQPRLVQAIQSRSSKPASFVLLKPTSFISSSRLAGLAQPSRCRLVQASLVCSNCLATPDVGSGFGITSNSAILSFKHSVHPFHTSRVVTFTAVSCDSAFVSSASLYRTLVLCSLNNTLEPCMLMCVSSLPKSTCGRRLVHVRAALVDYRRTQMNSPGGGGGAPSSKDG
jgi:hypothetical protein